MTGGSPLPAEDHPGVFQRALILDHHVDLSTPPSGSARLHSRLSPRHNRRAQELLPRFEVLGSTHPKASLSKIKFYEKRRLQSWKSLFPDPSSSPAHYAKTSHISCLEIVTRADAEEGGWTPTFSRVLNLVVNLSCSGSKAPNISLVPLYRLSPTVKALHISASFVPPRLLNLVYSFPLLHDLTMSINDMSVSTLELLNPSLLRWKLMPVHSSTPPPFTGTLKLSTHSRLDLFTPLLPLLINSRKLDLFVSTENDSPFIMALVKKCCNTLESICCTFRCKFVSPLRPSQ